ncbi:Gfo/Idh/MocA family protein [Komagataeibacter oboediens]|uniref:Gfo/Idh/MocA family oxidoreductase n=1 Tax=Komagataeibacter oboediens TaxID=65958 RepID=A0ABS5SHJ7_9PROT|nr:Gfo/Idh/MocA family oxidoreductase [Komagataeibacter oboediens]MBL7232984.1 Gfo/Idh/MocA family oxidoreductase [Komagataeibacter oboediens]MBT0673806.1 Gfo/Idh/MocA family oxidoreductase [Komagataeibacter oboediens]MBT0677471.1 Gfo/Idh/MocA family oxidoreductase [Komagataeibacter oboediens]
MTQSGTGLLRVGIVGAGHFGRFHALKVQAAAREVLTGIHDPDTARARKVAVEAGGAPVLSYPDLLACSDAIIVAAPAEHHFELARQALAAGKHVLVEKPMAATLAQADELAHLAQVHGVVLQVGHLLRYSAEHRAITDRISRPLYIEATRLAPYKPRGTDVSVILDLMIHDLDLVLSIVDSPIESVDALGAAVSSPFEDIANARVRFENGCVATIAASRISLKTERRMRVFSQEGYLSADFMKRELTMIGRTRGLPLPLPGSGGFRRESVTWRDHDTLAAEHAAFAASCLDGAQVLVDAVAGRRALAAALAVTREIAATRARMEASGLIIPPGQED